MQAVARASPAHQPLPAAHATLGHVAAAPKTEAPAQRWAHILDNFDAEGAPRSRNTLRRGRGAILIARAGCVRAPAATQ